MVSWPGAARLRAVRLAAQNLCALLCQRAWGSAVSCKAWPILLGQLPRCCTGLTAVVRYGLVVALPDVATGAGWKRVWPARPCHCPSRVASGASPVGPCDPALMEGGHAMPCHSSPPAQKRDERPVCCGVKTTPIPESAGPDSATTAEDVGGKVQPKSPPCLVVLQCRQMVPHPGGRGLAVLGRSWNSRFSSPSVLVANAWLTRSVNSSRSNRPAAWWSASWATAWSRSASEARSFSSRPLLENSPVETLRCLLVGAVGVLWMLAHRPASGTCFPTR